MRYFDGSTVALGDVVNVPIPSGYAKARVVMIGDTYEHLDEIDPSFLDWVKRERILDSASIVVEWIAKNPLAHNDPNYAPAGNYLFSPVDQWVTRDT